VCTFPRAPSRGRHEELPPRAWHARRRCYAVPRGGAAMRSSCYAVVGERAAMPNN